jgi:hypothetical protein
MFRPLLLLALPLAVASGSAAAQKGDFAPKPDTYLCPHTTGTGAVDCFVNAVEHLYTMCRQVKSIEIIEFGYEKSDAGVNGAKSEYCVDKHKLSMTRPYQAALREATGSGSAVDGLRALHELWLKALAELKWKVGESADQYKARVVLPYEAFRDRASAVRTALASGKPKVAAAAATPVARTGAKPKAAAAAAPPTGSGAN